LSLSPDGERIFVTNNLSRFAEVRAPAVSEVTVVDAERAVVERRIEVSETNLLQGVDWHPDGEFALITLNRTKNLVPMTRGRRGRLARRAFRAGHELGFRSRGRRRPAQADLDADAGDGSRET
jgi:hypothetical protein